MRKEPVHKSITNRVLVAGVEKSYWLVIMFTTAIPVVIDTQGVNIAASIIILVINLIIGRAMAEKDPYMFSIILRHIKHQEFYSGQEYYGGQKTFGFIRKKYKYLNQESRFSLPDQQ